MGRVMEMAYSALQEAESRPETRKQYQMVTNNNTVPQGLLITRSKERIERAGYPPIERLAVEGHTRSVDNPQTAANPLNNCGLLFRKSRPPQLLRPKASNIARLTA